MGEINTNGSLFTKGTLISKYIQHICDISDENKAYFNEKYKKIVEEKKADTDNPVFLSVVLRTQGKRIDELRECFLCLEAQTDRDFEVVLICHKAEAENIEKVKMVIQEQGEELRGKIRFFELNEGTRAMPINYGFAQARGEYIAIYDDDDILFDNWVEAFHLASNSHSGMLLHAYTFSQKWEKNSGDGYGKGVCAIDVPLPQFCQPFDLITQLSVNRCPLMSIAFPSFLFNEYGIIFDETLDVTEDWEYIMRVAPMCGVFDIEDVTSIYRLWANAESSYTLHNQEIWDNTYAKVRNRMSSNPMLIEPYVIRKLMDGSGTDSAGTMAAFGYPRMLGILFYDTGNGFSDSQMITANNDLSIPRFQMTFKIPRLNEKILKFRFDPCEYGGILIKDLSIELRKQGKPVKTFGYEVCRSNGSMEEDSLFFLHYDPQIEWKNQDSSLDIDDIVISGNVSMEIPESYIEHSLRSGKHWNIFGRKSADHSSREHRSTNTASEPCGYPRMLGIIYYNNGEGFSDQQMIVANNEAAIPEFEMSFEIPEMDREISEFRFDPCEYGGMIISDLSIELKCDGTTRKKLSMRDCRHNGYGKGDDVFFLHYDPQIIWKNRMQNAKINEIVITGKLTMEVPEAYISEAIKFQETMPDTNGTRSIIDKIFKK